MSLFLLAIAILVLASAFVSASQTALLSLSEVLLKNWKNGTDERKRLVASWVLRPRELLVTLFMLDVLVNLLIQNVSSSYFGTGASWVLRVGVPLLIILFLGEIIPKSLGFAHNAKIAVKIGPLIGKIATTISPIRKTLTIITSYVSRFIFFFLKKPSEISRDELHLLLKSREVSSLLTPHEAKLIDGFLSLQEDSVKELMKPREDVIFYSIDEPLTRLIHLFTVEGVSKVPVCNKTLDNLLGVISARQFFLYQDRITHIEALKEHLASAFFVPEGARARALLRQFPSRKESLALVVDEYGTITGLITYEDIIEAVVGEIRDVRDNKKPLYTRSNKKIIIASGKLELTEFEELFQQTLKSRTNMTTLGGWLTEQLGDIPKVGQQLIKDGFLFKILSADPQRVTRIYIKRVRR